MGHASLKSISLWYRYKTEVWPKETAQTAIVHNIMRTLRSYRNFKRLAYVTVSVTTGKTYYDELRKDPDAPDLMQRVMSINYELGYELVERLVATRDYPILYPADLTPRHRDWEQAHFQALWLNIIAEQCTEVHLCEGWNFSSGSVEEFTHVMQLKLGLPKHTDLIFFNTKGEEAEERERMRNIAVFDHLGNPMAIERGQALVEAAIEELETDFPTDRLRRALDSLKSTGDLLTEGFYQ